MHFTSLSKWQFVAFLLTKDSMEEKICKGNNTVGVSRVLSIHVQNISPEVYLLSPFTHSKGRDSNQF